MATNRGDIRTPRLITFGISHYCEKARWALDWHGIVYQEVCWPPGVHMMLARRLGTRRSTLPILLVDGALVQDSTQIIDWAEAHGDGSAPSLVARGDPTEAEAIERRMNERTAVQVRRHVYAETLTKHPRAVKPALFMNTKPAHRLLGLLMWPATRKRIMAGYDARSAAAADSLKESLEQQEAGAIRRELEATRWNVTQAAARLGLDRTNLHRKMRKYGIRRREEESS